MEARKYFVEPHILRFAQFERWSQKRVLEIGCGIGTDTIQFARHGARVTAVDLSERSLAIARERARLLGLADRIEFHRANAEELTAVLPRENYDLVYAFGVIHHTPHPERAVQQIRSYLGPESTVKLMVYHRHSSKALWILLRYGKGRIREWPNLIARYSEAEEGCPVTYTFTRKEISALLERNGLEVSDLTVEHIFPYRVSDYVRYRYRKVWYYRYMPPRWFRWLERHWGWHLCVTAVGTKRLFRGM
ncbi:MAG TPA: class I SAM-dependent methyltransferase [Candidatus Acidoferrales bacterium]|nr:class I SAM-dependent methyltransferase [Candidatus Acidoferrales bacterium]